MKKLLASLLLALCVYAPSAAAAVQGVSTTAYLQRTTALPAIPFSCTFWVLWTTAGATVDAMEFYETVAGKDYAALFQDVGNALEGFGSSSGTGSWVGSAVSTNTWYFVSFTRSGASGSGLAKIYRNGNVTAEISITTLTNPVNAATNWRLCGDSTGGGAIAVAAFKSWSVELTGQEVANEMWHYRPQRLANLDAATPLLSASDLVDYFSGSAHSWTAVGSPTTVSGPPISW